MENTPQSHTHIHAHTDTQKLVAQCHMLDVGPLSSVLGADGYIISLLEPDMEHVFVCLCLDTISRFSKRSVFTVLSTCFT